MRQKKLQLVLHQFQLLMKSCLFLGELSNKLVDTKKHEFYGLVYLVLKLALILPVATTSVSKSILCIVFSEEQGEK